ncbi:two component transcriptional regulator, LuxR family [Desulfomicrobium apsheronum]|uniref:Two component transcriptional regulator, LuxR family n=1 Tax=Desulfomicrobium apsheronum TaxID=52560 RepID=A0A1I3WIW4_9BACT|nr:response regulator transcription factor [Desulfomicrobium apsheronum]SFK06396.1 two component transcriptional regulator, LuxR family [Desulfomicrobium apsheronum]
MTKKRILLVEDDSLLRMGLKSMIDMHGEYTIDDDVATGKEALRSFQMKKQDVILLDLRLPDIPGTEVLQRIRQIEPNVKIIVLTASDDNDFIFDALEHGANAYVLKGSNPDELFLAVQYALDDDLFISPHLAKVIVRDYLLVNRQRKALPPMQNLTTREKEIVRLIIDGWKSKEIAESLFISIKTVDKHRSNILGKLGINSCNELRHGSLFLPDDEIDTGRQLKRTGSSNKL